MNVRKNFYPLVHSPKYPEQSRSSRPDLEAMNSHLESSEWVAGTQSLSHHWLPPKRVPAGRKIDWEQGQNSILSTPIWDATSHVGA